MSEWHDTSPVVVAGDRHNKGKRKLSMVLEARQGLEAIARAFEAGEVKYSRSNWKKGLPLTQILDSLMRHLIAVMDGEDIDHETGVAHLDLAAWNALIAAQMYHTRPDMDDRVRQ